MHRPKSAIVVVGASAGGVEALKRLVAALPRDLAAPVLIVLHVPPTATSVLPLILGRVHGGVVEQTTAGMKLERGRIYVAPPNYHLELDQTAIHLGPGARENGHRPSIDTTMRSAVRTFGDRVMAILLSGMLDDGVTGLALVQAVGGVTAVQDPGEAAYPGMSDAAIEVGAADHVMRVDDLADLICDEVPDDLPPLEDLVLDEPPDDIPTGTADATVPSNPAGDVSKLTCPACGGALWEAVDGGTARYQCRTGHAYAPESLLDAQSHNIEAALWSAYRALLERADLARRMARRLHRAGVERSAQRYDQMAEVAESQGKLMFDALVATTPKVFAPAHDDH
jgi:two-component system, chemotaxis family, protein-glutamate methylesterase/glutaminase